MADENNSDLKKIAELDFGTQKAEEQLNKINEQLSKLSTNAKSQFKDIGDVINNATLSDKQASKSLEKRVNEELKTQQQRIRNENKTNESMRLADYKGNIARENENNRHLNKMEERQQQYLKNTKTIGDQIQSYAKTFVIYRGFNALQKAAKEVIDEMVDVEQSMVSIERVMNDSSLDIDNYRDKLIQLAQDYGNSFDNVADVTLRLAQAGFNADESLALTEKTLLALNTADLNATQATDDMVAVMAQWGLMTGNAAEEAENYGDIIDKVNKVADNFPTTSQDLMDALKKVSSGFNLAGASIDETIATITAAEVASQRGGKVIGTALANITQQLKDEGRLNIAESLGLDFYTDSTKTQFKDIISIFQEMSEKMQKLKEEGKENSVEMQNLLSIFTVFRRNIGASLLGEMSGEDSTYMKALETSMNSYGYSLQENEKYMKTAKAAQEQFNSELLKLKTEVWDNGLEDVFRGIISGGTNLVDLIRNLVKNVGLLPTSIGAVTLAVTLLKKETQATTWINGLGSIRQINKLLKENNGVIVEGTESYKDLRKILINSDSTFSKYANTLKTVEETQDGTQQTVLKTKASIGGYAGSLVTATAKTVLMTAATVALQAAISVGITVAITALVTAFNNAIHAQEKYVEKHKELQQSAEDAASKYKTEADSVKNLRTQYEELIKTPTDKRTNEDNQKILELQNKINTTIKKTGKQVDLVSTTTNAQGEVVYKVNEKYQDQLNILKQIERQEEVNRLKKLKEAADEAKEQLKGIDEYSSWGTADPFGKRLDQIKQAGIDISNFQKEVQEAYRKESNISDLSVTKFSFGDLSKLDFESQLKYLTEWNAKLQEAKDNGQDVGKAYDVVSKQLKILQERQDNANNAIESYNNAMSEVFDTEGALLDYGDSLQAIMKSYGEDKNVAKIVNDISQLNSQFSDGKITVDDYFKNLESKINDIQTNATDNGVEMSEGMQAIFGETTRYIAEGIEGIQNAFDDGEMSFADYSNSLSEATDGLIELYAKQNDLVYNSDTKQWVDEQSKAIDDYATNLQNASDVVDTYSQMLSYLGTQYDYVAQHADAMGNANFQAADITTQAYKDLATNVGNYLAQMRQVSESEWKGLTDNVFLNTKDIGNETVNMDTQVSNALLTNSQNLNNVLNDVARQSQEATQRLATSTGNVISRLGNAINKFNYTISLGTEGSISAGGNLLDLALGKSFKPTSTLKLKITGSAGSGAAELGQALQSWGTDFTNYTAVKSVSRSLLQTIKPYTPTARSSGSGNVGSGSRSSGGSGGSGGSRSSGGSGSSRSYDNSDYEAKRAAEQATKEEEEAYKKRLETFKNYIKDKEKAESNWVSRLKDLGQLSNTDYLYITQQRIKRYQDYLNTVKNLTWLNAEDRAELESEYTEKIKDLQVDYLKYLKEKLNDEVDALKKANEEKIDSIKKEAETRINALKKVESETDRIRDKEDYLAKKKSAQEEIEYWEQRTGREAAEKLLEARKNLEDIDKEWNEKVEDWNLDDQIEQIEQERDAQVKAIQDQQEADIAAMQAVYDERVKLFVETGQIIYDNAGIQSQALYNQYKSNFVDPIANDLINLQNQLNSQARAAANTQSYNPPQQQQPQQQYETYTIKWGDTLTSIARRFNTTIDKIMKANPYVKNKNRIYSGKTLQIPKFHEGGEVKGNEEGYALLKPNEIVLKPEWASGIKKLANIANKNETIAQTTVNLKNGSLVNVNANIKNKEDVNYLTKKITKVLEDKFNIKK